MNGNDAAARNTEPGHGADPAKGCGGSGEGAGSALEAMLRKRQMRVSTEPDPAATPTTQHQDDKTPGE